MWARLRMLLKTLKSFFPIVKPICNKCWFTKFINQKTSFVSILTVSAVGLWFSYAQNQLWVTFEPFWTKLWIMTLNPFGPFQYCFICYLKYFEGILIALWITVTILTACGNGPPILWLLNWPWFQCCHHRQKLESSKMSTFTVDINLLWGLIFSSTPLCRSLKKVQQRQSSLRHFMFMCMYVCWVLTWCKFTSIT